MKKYVSEFIGTLILVLFGCGTAVVTQDIVAIALAFGLSIVILYYIIGNISGCHVNPAVSFALLLEKKISLKDFLFYVIAQILGALAGSFILYSILSSSGNLVDSLGANGYGENSAMGISQIQAFIVEIILTFVFILTILKVTSNEKLSKLGGFIIGLSLTFVHILGINLTGTSVNPARSLAPAIIMGGDAIKQVWVFIFAPLVGAALAVLFDKFVLNRDEDEDDEEDEE